MKEYKLVDMPRNKNVQRFFVYLNEEKVKKFQPAWKSNKIRVQMTREKSGGFKYGNGTCVIAEFFFPNGETGEEYIDTRYVAECATPDGFEKWSGEWLADYYKSADKIEQF